MAALAASGCWLHAPFGTAPEPRVAGTSLRSTPVLQAGVERSDTPRPPVTADQVHAGNAREMAQALWDEVDREQGARKGKE
ncbi:MAG TPA: hypothetical protein VNK04_26940 [Gemmataceae bacterium]|nr:hypothetical protein [Gemmataceae bacterium]